MTHRDIADWLMGAFPVESISNGEAHFPCPRCQHPNFYFNTKKKVGYCHRATCHEKPTLSDLIDMVGYGPELAGYVPEVDNKQNKLTIPVELPRGSDGNLSIAIRKCLLDRGVNWGRIEKFNIQASPTHIIVPVYEEDKLVQYVGRRYARSDWQEVKFSGIDRYQYAKGAPITDFLLGWDECKLWDKLTLVENTFNSIWLRDRLQCTTNFGSHLSQTQVEKIKRSRVKSVAIIWDEGAEYSAEKAVRLLRQVGVRAAAGWIRGQPDDHTFDSLEKLVHRIHKKSIEGEVHAILQD